MNNYFDSISTTVIGAYQKIENSAVTGYKAVEEGTVNGFRNICDFFIGKFFSRKGETIEETRERLRKK